MATLSPYFPVNCLSLSLSPLMGETNVSFQNVKSSGARLEVDNLLKTYRNSIFSSFHYFDEIQHTNLGDNLEKK